MNYFFQVCFRNNQRMIFSNKEYLCEETTKANLISLALPSFYKIKDFYGRWYSRFSLYVYNNDFLSVYDAETMFLYEVNRDNYSFARDLNSIITGKYYLVIYATK